MRLQSENIIAFMEWLVSRRGNAATTVNHRLSDIRGFCKFLAKKRAISELDYEAVREITDIPDDRVIDFTWLSLEDVKSVLDQVTSNRDSITPWCQAVRPAKGASYIVGGNPTWKGINHSTSSEPWSRSGNARFKRRQLGRRDDY